MHATCRLFSSRSAILEVERKFRPRNNLESLLRNWTRHENSAPFRSIRYTGEEHMLDTYFDEENKLSAKGIWLRGRAVIRNADYNAYPTIDWVAKVNPCGNELQSRAVEITGLRNIQTLLSQRGINVRLPCLPEQQNGGHTSSNVTLASLHQWLLEHSRGSVQVIAGLRTRRASFLLDDKFSFVIDDTILDPADATKTHHIVGEVELTRPVETGQDASSQSTLEGYMEQMDREIEATMLEYPSIFRTDMKPVGKLTAWFNYQNRYSSSKDLTQRTSVLGHILAASNKSPSSHNRCCDYLDTCWAAAHLAMATRTFSRKPLHASVPISGKNDGDTLA
ncbi:hypothetical protein LTR50_002067 [Elasticomyces elasticus]|nr:hypothetical protein LTR50_002067 [Elasticomyces elasticus]